VAAVENMLVDTKNAPGDMPLFVFVRASHLTPLTHAVFVKQLKLLLVQCGFDAKKYSGHSFRRGGATLAFSCNVSPLLIKMQGDWRSEAYQAYVTIPACQRWGMMKRLAEAAQQASPTK
jgi:hypothetical protein